MDMRGPSTGRMHVALSTLHVRRWSLWRTRGRSRGIAGHLSGSGSTNTANSVKSVPTQIYKSTRRCEARYRVEAKTARARRGLPSRRLGTNLRLCNACPSKSYCRPVVSVEKRDRESSGLGPTKLSPATSSETHTPPFTQRQFRELQDKLFCSNRNDFNKCLKRYALTHVDLFS